MHTEVIFNMQLQNKNTYLLWVIAQLLWMNCEWGWGSGFVEPLTKGIENKLCILNINEVLALLIQIH